MRQRIVEVVWLPLHCCSNMKMVFNESGVITGRCAACSERESGSIQSRPKLFLSRYVSWVIFVGVWGSIWKLNLETHHCLKYDWHVEIIRNRKKIVATWNHFEKKKNQEDFNSNYQNSLNLKEIWCYIKIRFGIFYSDSGKSEGGCPLAGHETPHTPQTPHSTHMKTRYTYVA